MTDKTRLNEFIQAPQLRVIDGDGTQLGIMSKADALGTARQRGLDLVEISPKAKPPVAKIIDWGKFSYQKTKQLQKQKRLAKNPDLKSMRIGLKIGPHDLDIKLRKIKTFLSASHKVKIIIFFRGREMAHKDMGFDLAKNVINLLKQEAVVEQDPQLAGKQLSFVLRRNKNAKAQDAQRDEKTDKDNQE